MKITLSQLEAKHACADQATKFKAMFGDSVIVTRELCIKHAADFDFDWAAQYLLSASALADYERVRASALADYARVKASAWVDYERVRASAFFDASQLEA